MATWPSLSSQRLCPVLRPRTHLRVAAGRVSSPGPQGGPGASLSGDEKWDLAVGLLEAWGDPATAQRLATIGQKVRNLREHGFEEGVSTRLLIYTAQLVVGGIAPRRACDVAISRAVSDEAQVQEAVAAIIDVILP